MVGRRYFIAIAGAAGLLAACTVSPEAGRVRGGGAGADIRNWGQPVQIHGTVDPAHDVPGVGKSASIGKQGTESTTNTAKSTASTGR